MNLVQQTGPSHIGVRQRKWLYKKINPPRIVCGFSYTKGQYWELLPEILVSRIT